MIWFGILTTRQSHVSRKPAMQLCTFITEPPSSVRSRFEAHCFDGYDTMCTANVNMQLITTEIHRKKNESSKVAGSGAALLKTSTFKGIVTKLKLEVYGVFSMVCTSQCWNFELYRL